MTLEGCSYGKPAFVVNWHSDHWCRIKKFINLLMLLMHQSKMRIDFLPLFKDFLVMLRPAFHIQADDQRQVDAALL